MFLAKMNYREVEAYLAEKDTVIIPVGSLENHGLHLPLGTDALIPEEITRRLDARSPLLIAPILNYGATDDLTGFAGKALLVHFIQQSGRFGDVLFGASGAEHIGITFAHAGKVFYKGHFHFDTILFRDVLIPFSAFNG